MVECRKIDYFGKGLFVDNVQNDDDLMDEEQDSQDDKDDVNEELVQGDCGKPLELHAH